MKNIAIFLFINFIFFDTTHAQNTFVPNCSENGTFNTTCNNTVTVSGYCPTWANGCGGGWIRSHGTPQNNIILNTGKPYPVNSTFMWSAIMNNGILWGEGIFRPYSFIANQDYKISIRLNSTGGNGFVYVYAANGLVQSSLKECGDPIPNISQKQLIGIYTGISNQWVDIEFNFVPTINYSQLWIYPQATSGVQYNLSLLYFDACTGCDASISYYNPFTSIIPIGDSRAGKIYVGSNSSLQINNNPSQKTRLIAYKEIILSPNFIATATIPTLGSPGSFFAGVFPCNFTGPFRTADLPNNVDISGLQPNESNEIAVRSSGLNKNLEIDIERIKLENKIKFYPTKTTGLLNISGIINEANKNFQIIVLDQSGRQLMYLRNIINNNYTLNLSNLSNGIYFVRVISKQISTTAKIILMK